MSKQTMKLCNWCTKVIKRPKGVWGKNFVARKYCDNVCYNQDIEYRRECASRGGQARVKKGFAKNPELARIAGSKGGKAVRTK